MNKIDTVNNNDTHFKTNANKTEQNVSVMINNLKLFRGLVAQCAVTVSICSVACNLCAFYVA